MSSVEHASGSGRRPSALRRWARRRGTRLFDPLVEPTKRHRRSQFRTLGAMPGAIVFLGDSITEGGLWDEWFPDAPVSNRGIGGEVVNDLLARLDTALDRPRAVFVLIGTNDLSRGTQPEDVAARAKRLFLAITERIGGAPLYVQSVMPRAAAYSADVELLRIEYRRLAAALPGVNFIDLVPVLGTPDGVLRTGFSEDKLHLNGDGYRAWVTVLRPLVDEASGQPIREATGGCTPGNRSLR